MKKIILVLFVALFSIAVVDAQQPKAKQTVTTTFVTDIDCAGCAKKVDNTIPYEKGVKDVKVDVAAKTVTVTFDPSKTNNETLIKAFAKIKIKAEAGCCDGCTEKSEKKECTDTCCGGHDHGHNH